MKFRYDKSSDKWNCVANDVKIKSSMFIQSMEEAGFGNP